MSDGGICRMRFICEVNDENLWGDRMCGEWWKICRVIADLWSEIGICEISNEFCKVSYGEFIE